MKVKVESEKVVLKLNIQKTKIMASGPTTSREIDEETVSDFLYAKAFDCVDHNKLWKILEKMENQTRWPASWETCMQVRKQQLELGMEQHTVSK